MFTVVKIMISAVIIGIVTEVSMRFPTYGGIIAALPIVSLLSLIWIHIQGEQTQFLSKFVFGVLRGLPATGILLLIVAMALRANVKLTASIIMGICGWGVSLVIQKFVFK
ncbi:conserved hypothetical protein [Alkaliphilus metalliredigens QYMF]|uniref:DUF3147 family protein n=1 Tax=Alkaliphilus metalliredigens (strain QYMF) TaxID=293826 RepID=A6TPC2_ALKMQ|nr:DUF3147 family protein [Alkaliphilus metalliredigens]ABR48040.1 conserved hypothetical protein [Alkaliphilus metalliredigens QYMF]